jgi:DNA-binding beta-propeller fold protein YncE
MLGRNLITSAAGNAAQAEVGWDIANASFDGSGQNFFSVRSQEIGLYGGDFKPDGTKMFIVGDNSRNVVEYSLSTAWDIATASFSQSLSVSSQDLAPAKVRFKPDGTKMFVLGGSGDDVNEYDLSTAWDISSATYSQNFSVFSQESTPRGLFFKPDGTKMYVIGTSGDDVNEYNLSTAWDVSTASYNQNFSVSGQESSPTDVFFKSDGTVMFVIGFSGDDINRYTLSTAWDVSTASYQDTADVSAQDTNPHGLFIKSDGLEIFMFGRQSATAFKYTVNSAWTFSNFSYSKPTTDYFDVASQETIPESLSFKSDGTKMYVMGRVGDDINEYNLSTAWSIHTASFSQTFSVAGQETSPKGLFFKPDGTKFYVTGEGSDGVYEYDLTTAWDVSTASHNQTFSISTQSGNPSAIYIKADGTQMFILDRSDNNVYEYSLSTAWDVSTASYDQSFSVASEELDGEGLFFKDDGTKMYVIGRRGDDVNQYSLSTAWDISSASIDTTFSVASLSQSPKGIFFKPDGTKFFITDDGVDDVVAFNIS